MQSYTWTSDNVYVIPTYTVVQPGVQLIIQPGTIIKFQSNAYLNIKGTLEASGTSNNNIVFTSYKDDEYGGDTNGDGTASTPSKGDWQFIKSDVGGTINCTYNRIRYGGKYYSMIYSYGGAVNVDHSIIEKSAEKAIETKGQASITDNQISDIRTTGVYVNSGSPNITGNTVTGGSYGIYVVNGIPTISNNTLNNNANKAVYIINGSPTISGNTLNGGGLADNYGIVIDNGTISVQNNSIAQYPNHEAILLGSNGSSISGSIEGNTMNECKYPLGFAGDRIPLIPFESNDFAGCSLLGINLNVSLSSQTIPIYTMPYIVKNLNIKAGSSVSIGPGTIFKLLGYVAPTVYGTLVAEGDAQNPIVFTSLRDDTFGGDTNKDGANTSPGLRDWGNISIADNGKSTFNYVTFCYGTKAIYTCYNGSEIQITNCDIGYMGYAGIDIYGFAKVSILGNKIHNNGKGVYLCINSSPEVSCNDIYNNGHGIDILGSSSARITQNYIHNNSTGISVTMDSSHQNNCLIEHNNIENNTNFGIYNMPPNNPPVVVAKNNWWGSASGPHPLGSGDKINSTTLVDASPWLTSPYVPEQPLDGVRNFCLHYDPLTRKWSLVLEPVDSGTGAHMIDKTLISLGGARSLDFGLSYNSLMLNEGPMGKGWAHNYETRLEAQADGSVKLRWSANRENDFTSTDQINYTSSDNACRLDKLVKNADGSYTLTRKDQSQYSFDASGRLIEERNRTGQALHMTYDSNSKLQTVSEPLSGIALNLAYDGSGLLQSATDNLNRQWSFTRDVSHNLTNIQYPNTTSSVFTYDAAGQVLSETDPQGNLLFLNTYDSEGRVVSQDDGVSGNQVSTLVYDDTSQPGFRVTTITDRTGQSRQYIHDSSYQLVKVIDELGNQTQIAYDADGNRTGITDAAGHSTTMTYDSRGNLLTTTDADSHTTTITYDDCNNVLSIQNAAGRTITNTYDANNRLTSITDPAGGVTGFTYNTDGLLTSKTSPRGGITSYTYQNGLLNSQTDPTGRITSFTYDAAGRLLNTTNPAGKTSTIAYDAVDNITSTSDPLSNTISFTYDANGKVLTQTDARGNITHYTYDGNRNLSGVTDALNHTTSFAYDGEDRLIQITDARGNISTISYDAKGRKISLTDPLGHIVRTEYDAVDNITGQYDALNNKIATIGYDNLNRPISVADALCNTTTNTYDALGNLTQTIDPVNQSTGYSYDNFNRLIQTLDALNGHAAQEFDADGNRTALIDPNNNRQEFSYDLAGRLTGSSSATGSLQYTYNQLGVLGSLINGRGQTRSLQYDDAGRPITQSDPDGTINCTYDANGNLLTVTDASGTITRQYDALNRVISYTDARGNNIGYAYDAVGNLTSLTYPDGKQVNYSYDAANRLTQVTDWAGRITTYTYDANNRLTQTQRPDGAIETRTYDAAGRLTQQLDKDQSNNTLTQFEFTYNAAGNVTTETNNLPDAPLPQQATMTYTSDNRLETCNGQSVSYDADGNMTSGPLNGQTTSFTFDSRNRLVVAGGTTYGYDAENNRISIADSVYQATFVVNPNASLSQVLTQTDGQGNQTFYTYGLGLIGEQNSAGYKAYHYDLRGSTVMLTDINGAATDTFQYGPYGELINHTGTSTTTFQYNGQYGIMNDGNGLYYMRARYYNPEIKRFMSKDTILGDITKPQTLNRYMYVKGNPISIIDPSGDWGYDVHYERTISWANEMNDMRLTKYAETIASGDNGVDTWRPPVNNTWQGWHFDRDPDPNIDSRDIHAYECLQEAIRLWSEADLDDKSRECPGSSETWDNGLWAENQRKEAMYQLGMGLHAIQDKYAHLDYGTNDFVYPITRKHSDVKGNTETFDDPQIDMYGIYYTPVPGHQRIENTEYFSKQYMQQFLSAI